MSKPLTSTTACVTVAPGKNGYLPPYACGVLLDYVPSFGAAVAFALLFLVTTLIHITQGIKYKKSYTWVLIMAGIWEVIAFISRALLSKHQNKSTYDTIFTLFLLLAPLWLNAFLYMTLGRMVWFFDETQKLAKLSAQRFGTVFVCLDIFSFIIQVIGAIPIALPKSSHHTELLGLHVYMAGVGLQQLFILCFTGLVIALHRRLLQQEKRGVLLDRLQNGSLRWRWLFYGIYFCLLMISTRIIFRIVDYALVGEGNSAEITNHEAYQYGLDATPILLAIFTLNYIHPARIMSGPESSWPRLSRSEKKELKRQKKAAKVAGDGIPFVSMSRQEEGGINHNH